MNIFVTHNNPEVAAKFLCDRHVPKMLLESTQMLSNAVHAYGDPTKAPYKPTLINHPCSKWVLESYNNFIWLFRHARAIQSEYTKRFNKIHACEYQLNSIENEMQGLGFPKKNRTKFVLCMPLIYRTNDVVASYRSYVKDAKTFARWQKGTIEPNWIKTHETSFNAAGCLDYVERSIDLPGTVPGDVVDAVYLCIHARKSTTILN